MAMHIISQKQIRHRLVKIANPYLYFSSFVLSNPHNFHCLHCRGGSDCCLFYSYLMVKVELNEILNAKQANLWHFKRNLSSCGSWCSVDVQAQISTTVWNSLREHRWGTHSDKSDMPVSSLLMQDFTGEALQRGVAALHQRIGHYIT